MAIDFNGKSFNVENIEIALSSMILIDEDEDDDIDPSRTNTIKKTSSCKLVPFLLSFLSFQQFIDAHACPEYKSHDAFLKLLRLWFSAANWPSCFFLSHSVLLQKKSQTTEGIGKSFYLNELEILHKRGGKCTITTSSVI